MTSFKVILNHKGDQGLKEVYVQAKNKEDAIKKALGEQSFPRKWFIVHVEVDANRMETKFKRKGIRYNT